MNKKRFFLSFVISFVFITMFEWLWHGVLLMDTYEATSNLWRPMESHGEYFHFMLLSQLGQALILSFIFTRHFEGKGLTEGLRFGAYMGALLAVIQFGAYCYMPVPFMLIAMWMVGVMVKTLGVGTLLALIYKK